MGVSICVASGKDGTGKSVITANLGIVLSTLNVETLILDGDVEGANIGLILGVDPGLPSLHDCLSGEVSCEDVVIESHGTNAVIGGIKLEQVVGVSIDSFPKILEIFTDKFDVVLVDSQGGLGNEAITVIGACQSVLLVLTPDINSVTNALKTLAVAKKLGSTVLGAIINKGGSPYDIPADKISDLLRVDIIAEIHEDETVKKSLFEAVPVVVEYPNSHFSKQITSIANKLIGRT
jgi:septum site-determining protein MinD